MRGYWRRLARAPEAVAAGHPVRRRPQEAQVPSWAAVMGTLCSSASAPSPCGRQRARAAPRSRPAACRLRLRARRATEGGAKHGISRAPLQSGGSPVRTAVSHHCSLTLTLTRFERRSVTSELHEHCGSRTSIHCGARRGTRAEGGGSRRGSPACVRPQGHGLPGHAQRARGEEHRSTSL